MEQRKRFNPKEKMVLLRELLENQVPIGELAEKYGIHPNVIYNWKKNLFENGESLFEDHRTGKSSITHKDKKAEEKITRLESKLKDKDSLISEIIEDNIRLKKKLNGDE